MTTDEKLEDLHCRIDAVVKSSISGDNPTAITIVSNNDAVGGQLILAHPDYDKKRLAARLRVCADIIDPPEQA